MNLVHLRIPNIEEIWSNQIFAESVRHTESENTSQYPIANCGR